MGDYINSDGVRAMTSTFKKYIDRRVRPTKVGVYILDSTCGYWNVDDWDGSATPSGIVVNDGSFRFLVSLDYLSTSYRWYKVSTSNTLIPGVNNIEYSKIGMQQYDYCGLSNTQAFVKNIGSTSTWACNAANNFKFPDGRSGYLPSLGELGIAWTYKTDINTALAKCGGVALSDRCWSSTQEDENQVWTCWFGTNSTSTWSSDDVANNSDTYKVRPFGQI